MLGTISQDTEDRDRLKSPKSQDLHTQLNEVRTLISTRNFGRAAESIQQLCSFEHNRKALLQSDGLSILGNLFQHHSSLEDALRCAHSFARDGGIICNELLDAGREAGRDLTSVLLDTLHNPPTEAAQYEAARLIYRMAQEPSSRERLLSSGMLQAVDTAITNAAPSSTVPQMLRLAECALQTEGEQPQQKASLSLPMEKVAPKGDGAISTRTLHESPEHLPNRELAEENFADDNGFTTGATRSRLSHLSLDSPPSAADAEFDMIAFEAPLVNFGIHSTPQGVEVTLSEAGDVAQSREELAMPGVSPSQLIASSVIDHILETSCNAADTMSNMPRSKHRRESFEEKPHNKRRFHADMGHEQHTDLTQRHRKHLQLHTGTKRKTKGHHRSTSHTYSSDETPAVVAPYNEGPVQLPDTAVFVGSSDLRTEDTPQTPVFSAATEARPPPSEVAAMIFAEHEKVSTFPSSESDFVPPDVAFGHTEPSKADEVKTTEASEQRKLNKRLEQLKLQQVESSESEPSDMEVQDTSPQQQRKALTSDNSAATTPPTRESDSYPMEMTHVPTFRERAFSEMTPSREPSGTFEPVSLSEPVSANRSRATSISSDNAPPFKAGFLTLYGDTKFDGRTLWFVLHHNKLLYYHSEPSHRGAALGEILLQDMQMIDIIRCHDRPKLMDLQTVHPSRKVYTFMAKTDEQRDEWVVVLQSSIAFHNYRDKR